MICKRCIINSSVPNVDFDNAGICSHCHFHEELEKKHPLDGTEEKRLNEIAEFIKKSGEGREYDCVVGLSGGCDSSYLLYILKERLKLRPLAINFDNTWNSAISVENIKNITDKLNIDLFTYVVDNDEFNDISLSFLRASVPDADIPTDVAIARLYYDTMNKFNIEYGICGHSFRTEGTIPLGWTYMDAKYIESVHSIYGKKEIKTFPNLELNYWLSNINKKKFRILYDVNYNKEKTKEFLTKNFDWKWYGGHHFENDYTRFVKSYLLPRKFHIDKRIIEFSALIRSNQKNRDEAIEEIKNPPYVDKKFINYIINRLGISEEEFDIIMNLPIKSYKNFETYKEYFVKNKNLFYKMLNDNLIPYTFYKKYCT